MGKTDQDACMAHETILECPYCRGQLLSQSEGCDYRCSNCERECMASDLTPLCRLAAMPGFPSQMSIEDGTGFTEGCDGNLIEFLEKSGFKAEVMTANPEDGCIYAGSDLCVWIRHGGDEFYAYPAADLDRITSDFYERLQERSIPDCEDDL